jgi:DNA-binding protein WhiA
MTAKGTGTAGTTDKVRDEIGRRAAAQTPRCCLTAEIAAMLRLSGGLYLSRGRPVIEAELDSWAAASRLRTAIMAAFAYQAGASTLMPAAHRPGVRYLVRVGPGRDAENLARQAGLIIGGGQALIGMPRPVVAGRRCDCQAAWRGAFLAAGALTDPVKATAVLTITCPGREVALALAGTARRIGLPARACEFRGASQVRLQGPEGIANALCQMGAAAAAEEWLDNRSTWLSHSDVAALAGMASTCATANLNRARHAANEAAGRAERALEILGGEVPGEQAEAARLRIEHPDATISQLGTLACPPVSKDTIAGRIRRLLDRADARAARLGVPGTSGALTHAAAG